MALIDLKTNLKNIKYSKDRLNGGFSNQPYIRTRIPGVLNSGANVDPIFKLGADSYLDYPIRGGALTFDIGNSTYTLSSQIDKSRIKKFFEDKPRGEAFIKKQMGLQLSNPKMETGNTLYGLGQSAPLPGLLENTRVYNRGINTLAQVGVQGTGAHAIRHGTMPFNPWQKNYYSIVNQQNVSNNKETNRLLILAQLKMTSGLGNIISTQNVPNINTVNNLGISLNRNVLFQYLGGPGSVYGIGNTIIKRAVDTTLLKSRNAMTYNELLSQNVNNITGDNVPKTMKIKDFRDITQGYGWTSSPLQVENRFYTTAGSYKDKMNLLYPFVFQNNQAPWDVTQDADDLIKFAFEAISNDSPEFSTAIFFRAFLTAGITDNNSAGLNAFKYMGRGEDFFTYQGFSRTISFSFRVYAGSKEELRPMYNRINNLISQVYPDYSPNGGIMRAPVVRVTIGDYIYRVPGFLESVNVTVDNNTPWEINLQKSENGDVAQLPHVVDIAVSFKPIMDILPKRFPYLDVELTDSAQPGSVPKLIGNVQTDNFIDSFMNKLGSESPIKKIDQNNANVNSMLQKSIEDTKFSSRLKRDFGEQFKNSSKISDQLINDQFKERQNFEKNVPNYLVNKGLI